MAVTVLGRVNNLRLWLLEAWRPISDRISPKFILSFSSKLWICFHSTLGHGRDTHYLISGACQKEWGQNALLDSARQGQSHVNYAKFLSFYFKQQLLKYLVLYTFFCGMIWMDILEPSDSDTVELGESWIKFNGRRSKIWNWKRQCKF